MFYETNAAKVTNLTTTQSTIKKATRRMQSLHYFDASYIYFENPAPEDFIPVLPKLAADSAISEYFIRVLFSEIGALLAKRSSSLSLSIESK
ncbi:hypothetical protein ACTHPJ_24080 [Paenibacillus amylolyticus]